MKRSSSISIALFAGLALTAIVHIYRLNQGLWGYSSSSALQKKNAGVAVVVSHSVVIHHQNSNTTTAAAFPLISTDDAHQASAQQNQQQQQQPQRPQPNICSSPQNGGDDDGNTTTPPLTAPEWLKIRGNQARWLHIGKAGGKKENEKEEETSPNVVVLLRQISTECDININIFAIAFLGGTFLDRLKHKWRVNMLECHPHPCNTIPGGRDETNDQTPIPVQSAILIRDPVDRFVSAFYWRANVLCLRAGYLCNPQKWPPPRQYVGAPDSKKEIEINLIFNASQANVNVLASRLCRNNNDANDSDDFQQAALDVRRIGHLKETVVDWLEQSSNAVAATAASSSSSASSSAAAAIAASQSSPTSIMTPIVLERGVDFDSQIDAFVQHVIVNHTRIEAVDSASFAHRLAYIEQQDCLESSVAGGKSSINASPKSKYMPLSEENVKCVARFYHQDYQAIRDLATTHCTTEACRLGIESIWNRRAHLLLS
jgi:hypothetical protein